MTGDATLEQKLKHDVADLIRALEAVRRLLEAALGVAGAAVDAFYAKLRGKD